MLNEETDILLENDMIVRHSGETCKKYMLNDKHIATSITVKNALVNALSTKILKIDRVKVVVCTSHLWLMEIVSELVKCCNITSLCYLNETIGVQDKTNDNIILIDGEFENPSIFERSHKAIKNIKNIKQHIVLYDHQLYDTSRYASFTAILNKTDLVRYRLKTIKQYKRSSLCFAADTENPDDALRIVDEIGDKLVICKIHMDTMYGKQRESFKERLIAASIRHDFLIMEDRKFNDISYIVQKQYKEFRNWVDLVTVHALVTSDVIKQISGAMIVGSMSNNTYDFTEKAIELAKQNSERVAGFITQKRIHVKNSNVGFCCMTPGVKPHVEIVKDQKYRAIKDVDTDFYVVGRGIYESENPLESAKLFCTE